MANQKNAQELLKWGITNTPGASGQNSGDDATTAQITADIAAGKRPDLADPALYEALMGKSEAQMMQDELSFAVDQSHSVDDRCTALDNFEMLIEQIDNANNIFNMKMWTPLVKLLEDAETRIQKAAAWIVGSAVQNNDKAQVAVLQYQPFTPLLNMLHSPDNEARAKTMYALSGILKHNPAAVKLFEEMGGWNRLKGALLDPNIPLRRKTAFLINTLLFQDDKEPGTSREQEKTTLSATGLAPSPADPGNPGSAPLERGPETMLTGIPHPDVAKAVFESGLLRTLVISLLPSSAGYDLLPAAGPDGDAEPRADLDFAEKAVTAVLTFAGKLQKGDKGKDALSLDDEAVKLLKALAQELAGAPIKASPGIKTRYEELSIEKEAFQDFEQKIASWSA